MLNKKAKSKNMFKKSISTALASTFLLGSGATFCSLNKAQAIVRNNGVLGYFNDTDLQKQTRKMMNGVNELNTNDYWMKAEIESDTAHTGKYAAKLYFSIPGYDLNNLKFFVGSRKTSNAISFSEYSIASGSTYLYLSNLDSAGYEVHVYNGSLAEQNFVCKADFECFASAAPTSPSATDPLYNAAGAPFTVPSAPTTAVNLTYIQPTTPNEQLYLTLTTEAVPFDATTIKVAFFASSSSRNGEDVHIDQVLYDYVNTTAGASAGAAGTVNFLVDAQWGTDSNTVYEAHFYKDSVKPENFICKAINIKAS